VAMDERSLHVEVHYENGAFWAQVSEWPGCFATGATLDELIEALCESIGLFVTPGDQEIGTVRVRVDGIELRVGADRTLSPAREEPTGDHCRRQRGRVRRTVSGVRHGFAGADRPVGNRRCGESSTMAFA